MHTASVARRKGYGAAIIRHILAYCHQLGISRVSLETAVSPATRGLYSQFGFVACAPFGCYQASPISICMTLALKDAIDVPVRVQ